MLLTLQFAQVGMVIASSRNGYFVTILWHQYVLAQKNLYTTVHCSTVGDRLVDRDEELGEDRLAHERYFMTVTPYISPLTTKLFC